VSGGTASGSGTGALGASAPGRSASPRPTSQANDGVPAVGRSGAAAALDWRTASGGRTVALTFDDGPDPVWTPRVLDVLARYHAHAVFCEIGPQASANPALVRRILAAGDRLCDHTVHHDEAMHRLPAPRMTYEITGAQRMIQTAGGPGTRVGWFRAPGGDFTPTIRRIAAGHGMRPLAWTVDTRDWSRPGVAAILAHVRAELRPGGIVLMHDGGGNREETVAALRQLLPWLQQQGFRLDFPAA
jgi:peptidoglycan/xylan/chitin deacetylase (PgdA/CDA1 family)